MFPLLLDIVKYFLSFCFSLYLAGESTRRELDGLHGRRIHLLPCRISAWVFSVYRGIPFPTSFFYLSFPLYFLLTIRQTCKLAHIMFCDLILISHFSAPIYFGHKLTTPCSCPVGLPSIYSLFPRIRTQLQGLRFEYRLPMTRRLVFYLLISPLFHCLFSFSYLLFISCYVRSIVGTHDAIMASLWKIGDNQAFVLLLVPKNVAKMLHPCCKIVALGLEWWG